MLFRKSLSDLSRKSLRWILVFDTACLAFFLTLIILFPDWRDEVIFPASIWFVLLILHSLVAPFKGLDYVPNDESPDNPFCHYWIISIAIAVCLAFPLTDYATKMIGP